MKEHLFLSTLDLGDLFTVGVFPAMLSKLEWLLNKKTCLGRSQTTISFNCNLGLQVGISKSCSVFYASTICNSHGETAPCGCVVPPLCQHFCVAIALCISFQTFFPAYTFFIVMFLNKCNSICHSFHSWQFAAHARLGSRNSAVTEKPRSYITNSKNIQ